MMNAKKQRPTQASTDQKVREAALDWSGTMFHPDAGMGQLLVQLVPSAFVRKVPVCEITR